MKKPTQSYRELASRALADADAATLDNVKERNLRAAAAWTQMAERLDQTEKARALRTPTPVAAAVDAEVEAGEEFEADEALDVAETVDSH